MAAGEHDPFDVAILGAGPGGYVCAIRAAQLGLRTCLIEKRATLGGTCLNIGCIPSKALLESSELFALAKGGMAAHGITVGAPAIDVTALMARKERIVKELTSGLAMLMKKNKVTVRGGRGELLGGGRLRVTAEDGATEDLAAKAIVLAMGSEPVALPFLPPMDEQRVVSSPVVSSTGALAFDAVPEHLIVIGAGVIGLELGSVWARLGAKVTVVELLPRILPASDEQLAKLLQRALTRQGLTFHLGCKVQGAEVQGDRVQVRFADARGAEQQLQGDRLLVAVGRRPVTAGCGLEAAGVTLEEGGRVQVNERFATSAEGVYAIGDLIRGPMLAHKAEDEGMAVAELLAGKPGHVNYSAIPNVAYTEPELAEVGLTEAQAKEQGHTCRVGRFSYKASGRAKTLPGEADGLVKIVADAESDRILGAQLLGPRASELVAELVLALEFSASAEDVARTCHAHPTLSEIVREAALAVDGRAIHS